MPLTYRICIAFALLCVSFHASAATFTVSSTADSGLGSLRQAILDANASLGTDLIEFNIPAAGPQTITPVSPLPDVTQVVVIDGTSQPGYAGTPLIEVSGQFAGAGTSGLIVRSGNCVVRGLAIVEFGQDGIRLEGGSANVIQANHIGTDSAGLARLGNASSGIAVIQSSHNLIGGSRPGEGNLISGGNDAGIYINGSLALTNFVQGNWIGTDITGAASLSNLNNGILIHEAMGNVIGGTGSGEGNLISGNGTAGVYLLGSTTRGNLIQGNQIGTDPTGTASVGNFVDGVVINQSSFNRVGGSETGAGNVISGNLGFGMSLFGGAQSNVISGNLIGTDASGTLALGNMQAGIGILGSPGNQIGGADPDSGNVISGNMESGVILLDTMARGNWIQGNLIGTDLAGTTAIPNVLNGVAIFGRDNQVGGATANEGNLISGNGQNGVYLAMEFATGNKVLGNRIGTDLTGTVGMGNGLCGVMIEEADNNTIGGTIPGSQNVISGNDLVGTYLLDADNNVIQGNLIGTDLTGSVSLANGSGVGLTNSANNTIGGAACSTAGNVISGNTASGLYIIGADSSGNVVQANLVGTDASGSSALGNGGQGIYLSAPDNLIGGDVNGAGNVVSGNQNVGISIGDPVSTGNVLQGNYIGLKADGVGALGNSWHGIEILDGASGNIIGGTAPLAGNRIAYALNTGYDGVRIRSGCIDNPLRGNAIFNNAGLGIDLGDDGVDANDALDSDGGANQSQNAPVIVSASGRYKVTISGTFNSKPNQTYELDFFVDPTGDPTGNGEGEILLGSLTANTDASGDYAITTWFLSPLAVEGNVSAIATDAAGNTSEFGVGTINSVPPIVDTDGDGMPDDYEVAWGFDPQESADADEDADNDGNMTNLDEYQARTNPLDASDGLLFLGPPKFVDGQACLWLTTAPGLLYTVEYSDTVTGSWLPVDTDIPGTGNAVLVVDPSVSGVGRYYRALAQP